MNTYSINLPMNPKARLFEYSLLIAPFIQNFCNIVRSAMTVVSALPSAGNSPAKELSGISGPSLFEKEVCPC